MDPLLGKGLYSIPEAARIIRATGVCSGSTSNVRNWAVGYNRRHKGDVRHYSPLLLQGAQQIDGDYYLTFLQLLECRMIGKFRDYGVSVAAIRAAVSVMSDRFGVQHPFALRRLWTDGKRIYTDVVPKRLKDTGMRDGDVMHDIVSGQGAFDSVRDFFLNNIDYTDGVPDRLWPLGHESGIVIDPQRSFGRPIDAATGISSSVLYSMCKGGTPAEDVAKWHGATTQVVKASVEFESLAA